MVRADRLDAHEFASEALGERVDFARGRGREHDDVGVGGARDVSGASGFFLREFLFHQCSPAVA
jgi:hypothetical protein